MRLPFSGPAGIITAPTETETPDSTCSGFQFIPAPLRIDSAAKFRSCHRHQHINASGVQADKLAVDRRIGHLVGRAGNLMIVAVLQYRLDATQVGILLWLSRGLPLTL